MRISKPFGQTFLLTILILALLSVSLEVFARTDLAMQLLPLPGVGSRHRQFDILLARLEQLVAQEGDLDCLILGSSMVHHALDPVAIERAYYQETQRPIRCFNFGVKGLNPYTASILAPILLDLYDPWLLIYGLDIPAFYGEVGQGAEFILLNNPWVRYRRGEFTLDGWLVQTSMAYRYFMPFRNWMRGEFVDELDLLFAEGRSTTIYGYRPTLIEMDNISSQPDPVEEARFFEAMADLEVLPKNFSGLRDLLDLHNRTQVIVVEIPVHETFLGFIEGGLGTYMQLRDRIHGVAERAQVVFWESFGLVEIPDTGWVNRNHLNSNGALILSEWLGHKLGEAVQNGSLNVDG